MLKPQLLSEKKCLEKRQSVVGDIFKDVNVKNDVVYTEEYPSIKESLSSNYEEEKVSSNISNFTQLQNKKMNIFWEMETVYLPLLISLYLMIVLDRSSLENW